MTCNEKLQHSSDAPELINLNETARITTMSRTMINRLRSEGKFVAAVSLGEKRIAFPRQEVLNWIAERIANREAI